MTAPSIDLGQLAPLDAMGNFLPRSIYQPFTDLDGAAAAAFLREHGATDVVFEDLGTNGQAVGRFEGGFVYLSTNGFFAYVTKLRAGAAAWYADRLAKVTA